MPYFENNNARDGAKNLHLSLDTVMYFEIKEYMKKPLLKGEFNSLY